MVWYFLSRFCPHHTSNKVGLSLGHLYIYMCVYVYIDRYRSNIPFLKIHTPESFYNPCIQQSNGHSGRCNVVFAATSLPTSLQNLPTPTVLQKQQSSMSPNSPPKKSTKKMRFLQSGDPTSYKWSCSYKL